MEFKVRQAYSKDIITDLMRTGCAEGTPLCETHCKPQSGAAVGITV